LGQSAALYCRVSTADQTCARQERDLRAFAKKAGYKVVGVWKETASGTKDERAERKKVLALAQARKVDVILVTELTRWGRSMLDLFHTLQDLLSATNTLPLVKPKRRACSMIVGRARNLRAALWC
jgi:putative DNA-invertase from lambdoid prophage Rac